MYLYLLLWESSDYYSLMATFDLILAQRSASYHNLGRSILMLRANAAKPTERA